MKAFGAHFTMWERTRSRYKAWSEGDIEDISINLPGAMALLFFLLT